MYVHEAKRLTPLRRRVKLLLMFCTAALARRNRRRQTFTNVRG
jgi:hypothetical protein